MSPGTSRPSSEGRIRERFGKRRVNTVSTWTAVDSEIFVKRRGAHVEGGQFSYAGGSGNCRVAPGSWARGLHSVSHSQPKGPHLARVLHPQTIFVFRARSGVPFFVARFSARCVRSVEVSAKLLRHFGEVSERFKEHAWKACVGEILPWVRIPPSPPFLLLQWVRALPKILAQEIAEV